MNKFSTICFLILTGTMYSQDLFKSDYPMPIGAYYYPEHWPKENWERDLKKMAELGFEFTHYAEFAWAMLEPEEGKFDFGWLDTAIYLAGKNNLEVIMCTPTPCPPAWLSQKHPEILIVDENGRTMHHGSRLHANGMNETYRFYVERIVTQLAQRYGNNPIICGWQIDNEPHLEGLYDYSEATQVRFQEWLKDKYQSIDSLNLAWGTAFWSQTYNNFEQIRIPNRKENAGGSPTSLLDFKRFTANETATFIRYQSNILKKYIYKDQWITTNYAYYKFLPPVDLFLNQSDLDFTSHTMYLLSTYLNYPKGSLSHRLGSGMELAFSSEFARSVTGYTGIMELQPGQINWGKWNSRPLPGAVRMWIWHSFALGDQFVCTYRFRQPVYGSEQFHEGIMDTDGTSLSHGGEEYVNTIEEIKKAVDMQSATTVLPADVKSRLTGFLWNQSNIFDMENLPHNHGWDPWQHYYTYYESLKRMGCKVEFINYTENPDPEAYPFIVAPAFEIVSDEIIKRLTSYTENGGHLILSCRSGLKDVNGNLHPTRLQEPIWNLIGAGIDYYDHLPPGTSGHILMNEKQYTWNTWADILIPFKDTEVIARHNDQFYKGSPVAVTRKYGKGTVTYIGAWSENSSLEYDILRKIFTRNGATILNLPEYVFTEYRNGYHITVNYSSEPWDIILPENSHIVVGTRRIGPGEVTVWK